MKIGRNDPCPCGSGKKYKKCCIDGKQQDLSFSKDYFRLKGENSEKIVQELAEKTFLIDWCFPNPKLPNGNELCDLLVVFDDIAIIWQVKDLKLDNKGFYKKKEVEKNLRQLSGARRQLFELKTSIKFENARRAIEEFDSEKIKEIYLISVLLGEGEEMSPLYQKIKDQIFHVFPKDFTQIIFNELDTISDFTEYLRKKEQFVKECIESDKSLTIFGGEEELLTIYIKKGRNFSDFDIADQFIIEEGNWVKWLNDPQYIMKKDDDRISYAWDFIIDRVHTGTVKYEKVARELASYNRFRRRMLGKAFYNAFTVAKKSVDNEIYCDISLFEDVTYCFLFFPLDVAKEKRIMALKGYCHVTRGMYPQNTKVIGIASDRDRCCSFDILIMEILDWTVDCQQEMDRIQKQTGILTNTHFESITENEFR